MAKAERLLSWILTIAAVILVAIVVRREVLSKRPAEPRAPALEWRYVDGWRELVAAGRRRGPANALIEIVEFSDLECPFCRQFHQSLGKLLGLAPDRIAFTFVHYPGSRHRFAKPAARAAECAAAQGRFFEFVEAVFAQQDSLGLRPFTSYARAANIPDADAFAECASDTARIPLVDEGLRLGKEFGITATPTILVNGWRIPPMGRDSILAAVVTGLAAGRSPFPPRGKTKS